MRAVVPQASSSPPQIMIECAIEAFAAEFEEHAATSMQKNYRILLAKMKALADGRG
jgi:hypothetical protein